MKRTKMATLIGIMLALLFVIFYIENAVGDNMRGLFSAKLKDRRSAYEKIISVKDETERQQIIMEIVKILRTANVDRSFEGPLHLAIKALGELKAKEAIPDMLPYFTFIPVSEIYITKESIPTQGYYPTARAFVQIGEPVIKYMKDIIITGGQSDEAKQLAAWVIKEIMGKEVAIEEIQVLERQYPKAGLKSGKKLSVYIRDFKPTFYHPYKK